MKVFVSSLISSFEPYREAARAAIATLRHEPVMAEEFGAQPNSPQIACLAGLRSSDLVVLILGERYGPVQPGSGISATHEEYREARGRKPVIAFVQADVTPDREQAAFIKEVQGWEGGLFRGQFKSPTDLQVGVTRALHDFELAKAVAPLDVNALIEHADALVAPSDRSDSYGAPILNFSLVGGPLQRILRPAEIEAKELTDALHQAALFGNARVFDATKGVATRIERGALVLEQDQGARVWVDEHASLKLRLLISQPQRSSFSVLVEETVQEVLDRALGYSNWFLEHIDRTQRLTHVAVAAHIGGSNMLTWRTQREQDGSPNSMSLGTSYGAVRQAVHVSEPRAALRLNPARLVEDLLVPLRRQWQAP